MVTDGPVDDEVSGAVDGEEKVTDTAGDVPPNFSLYVTTVGVVSEELILEEILGQVEEEAGQVADNVEDDNRTQSAGRVGQTLPVLSYLILAEHATYLGILLDRPRQPTRKDPAGDTRWSSDCLSDKTHHTAVFLGRDVVVVVVVVIVIVVVTVGVGVGGAGAVIVGDGGGGSLPLEGEIDGGVGDEKEEDGYYSSTQASGQEKVVFYVVGITSQGGPDNELELSGDVVGVSHVDGGQLQHHELRDVEQDRDDEGGEDEDQGVIPAGESHLGRPVPQRSHHGNETLQSDAHQEETLTRHQDVLQGKNVEL